MTREEAARVFEDAVSTGRVGGTEARLYFPHNLGDVEEAVDTAIAALREQESAENAHCNCCKKCNGWISVEERLPEETGVYLVHDISMGIRVFYFGKGDVRSGWFGVTQWMPLPEPPKEDTNA